MHMCTENQVSYGWILLWHRALTACSISPSQTTLHGRIYICHIAIYIHTPVIYMLKCHQQQAHNCMYHMFRTAAIAFTLNFGVAMYVYIYRIEGYFHASIFSRILQKLNFRVLNFHEPMHFYQKFQYRYQCSYNVSTTFHEFNFTDPK